ncbi:MAG: Xaa-Pro peptidase family protein, partial [Thermoflexales bacterium]|nr:Xaa-Pro peptidase family protein [Thermoflexales bacterium]
NLIYFTGLHMHLSERPIVALLPADDAPPILIAPFFEVGKATNGAAALPWQVYSYRDGVPYREAFRAAAEAHDLRGKTVAVEPLQMRLLEWTLLGEAAPGIRQASAADLIAPLRMVKDADEIAAMRRAVALSEAALAQTLREIREGMTERQVANLLMGHMLAGGAHGLPFTPLVQCGPNGANPHSTPSDRPLRRGDMVVIDFGLTVDDYSSDITRTIAIGEPDEQMREIYEVVKAANAAGRAAAMPGATGAVVDRAARSVIEAAGYGQYFTHRTGHGLGLEGHEPPYMVATDATPLRPGMTFTVEPGVYIPGKGGVRIEDDVLITEDGHQSLTSFTRELIVV